MCKRAEPQFASLLASVDINMENSVSEVRMAEPWKYSEAVHFL